ncbi:MAG TPA: hypothetical protein VGJ70_25475 [Solirubrobacteraceae bacterium]|jgi:ABC-type phosphate transport system auxiliary subunit
MGTPEIRVEDRRPERTWDWTAELDGGREAELEQLRGTVKDLRAKLDGLEQNLKRARVREQDLRGALAALAARGLLGRRAFVAELRRRGLL